MLLQEHMGPIVVSGRPAVSVQERSSGKSAVIGARERIAACATLQNKKGVATRYRHFSLAQSMSSIWQVS